jgi:hypothetical protein
VWQALRSELYPLGLEVVTVALDTGGVDAAHPWIERAKAIHPSLIDQAHVMDALFGIVNVPSGLWIDESGMLVRPPETAFPRRPSFLDRAIPSDATPLQVAQTTAVKSLRIEAEKYVAALRDWVRNGERSRFALLPDEVIQRSRPCPPETATAAAHFALAQHLYRNAQTDAAIGHFRAAYQLQPDNWTYKRQAWSLLPAGQNPLEIYGGDWLTDVEKIGAENYYPALEM